MNDKPQVVLTPRAARIWARLLVRIAKRREREKANKGRAEGADDA